MKERKQWIHIRFTRIRVEMGLIRGADKRMDLSVVRIDLKYGQKSEQTLSARHRVVARCHFQIVQSTTSRRRRGRVRNSENAENDHKVTCGG